jgi:dipeptide transport system ATP-binding protein
VGESGSGKSVAMLALMGLLPWTARVSADRLRFDGQDLTQLSPRQRRQVIGRDMSMVFQEPMSSLNPCFTVGWQIAEALAAHTPLTGRARRERVIELLERVGLPDPAHRARSFPHQLSGGQCQRVMIAMALACRPKLLIADEPTTALDVTIQAQIMDLLTQLRRDTGMAMVLITHDLGLVAECADRVLVQYAGHGVETQKADGLFTNPHHPYTAALLAALPERARGRRLDAIDGLVPGPNDRPAGCLFAPRCVHAQMICHERAPGPAIGSVGRALCHTPLQHGRPLAMPMTGSGLAGGSGAMGSAGAMSGGAHQPGVHPVAHMVQR